MPRSCTLEVVLTETPSTNRSIDTHVVTAKPLQSVLIKPAGPDCNLRCSYCFYLKKAEHFGPSRKHRMSEDILESVIRQVMTHGEQQVSFGWQGGEPTLMGLPFFQKAVALQQRYGRNQSVGNGLQTNGQLLDKHWAEFLRRYNFLVGLSVDGPEEIHDRYRTTSNARGSWSRVVQSAKLLLDTGVAVNGLSVVNDHSVSFPEEIYQFHKDLGLNYMQFIPCIEPDPSDPGCAAPFSVSAEAYGAFLCSVFDLWLADFRHGQPTTSIRHFDSLLYAKMGLDGPECTIKQTCGDYLVIEHNGDVYSCDFFVEPAWRLGNVANGTLIDMLNSERQQEFGLQKGALADQCATCNWLAYCYGGCPKDRRNNPQHRNVSAFCESYKHFFTHADQALNALAEQWKQNAMSDQPHPSTDKQSQKKIGRNSPCPCGSGRKFKKCCMQR